MTLFDATKGKKAVSDAVETASHEFAAVFEDLSPRQQRSILNKMNELMSNPDSVTAFASGTYAQDSSGAAAKPLGAGTSNGPVSDDDALQAIMASSKVPQGVKAAILRVITPSDPAFMDVMADGTPKELDAARTERTNAKNAQTVAEDALKNERDENKSGSLAEQLKTAKASPAAAVPAADSVKKSDVKAKVDKVKKAEADLTTSYGSNKINGTVELDSAITELETLVS